MIRSLRDLIARRELLWVLVLKEFRGRYRQSLLGLGWAVVQPLGLTFFAVLLRSVLARSGVPGRDVLDVFAAVLPWTFFSNAVIFGTASIVRNSAVLKKVYFPREVFVLSAVLTCLVDFCVAFLGLVVLMAWLGVSPGAGWVWLPVLVGMELLLAFGVCLFTASAAVYKRDIIYGMPFLMMFWMFLSPVFYGLAEVPEAWRGVYLLNPMAGVIAGFRSVIVEGRLASPEPLLYAAAATLGLLALGYGFFKRIEMRFADVI